MGSVFLEITVIICLASFLSIIFRLLKQPTVLAYILTGVLLGPMGLFRLENQEILRAMGEFGITFLLFLLGLELRISELKSVGKIAFMTGALQIIVTAVIGYIASLALGFSPLSSLYIGVALTLSSTIIVVKLLSDKRDLNSLYGKMAIGILLVQDLVAIFALIILSGFGANGGGGLSAFVFLLVILKAILLCAVVVYLSQNVLPKLVHMISSSQELLFLFSVAWAFGMAAFVNSPWIGFSIEIGGFLAGLSLANSSENFQIAAKVKPLRDFFITIFFVILGIQMIFTHISSILFAGLILSLFVLIGNPLIVMVIMGFLGFRKRTLFLTGVTIAQISEFSLILVFLGNKLGHIPSEVVSLVTLVGVITFILSTYMILNGNRLYTFFSPYLGVFERKHTKWEHRDHLGELSNHVVLAGANRTGQSILDSFQDVPDSKIVVVDFDPDVVDKLKTKGFLTLFGDIADPDIQERIQLDRAKLVISTVQDLEDNLALIGSLNMTNRKAKIILLANDQNDARKLYRAGADYVVIPHLSSGRHIAKLLKDDTLESLEHFKSKELAYL